MAAATTAPESEHRALLALLATVYEGSDEAAAAAVTAFTGDINARSPNRITVLHAALRRGRVLTVAALAARGDCNPNYVTRLGTPALCHVAGWCHDRVVATFLAHFPTLNIHARDPAGNTPLHYAAIWFCGSNVQLLLDAGADPTIHSLSGKTPAQVARRRSGHTNCTKLLEAAEAWHSGLRRGWLRAVVGISKNIAV